jgi:hypothetical protein
MSERKILELDDDEQAISLKAFYEAEIASDEKKIVEFQLKMESKKKVLEKINKILGVDNESKKDVDQKEKQKPALNGYDKNLSMLGKFKYVLNKNKKAVTMNEALSVVRQYEAIGSGMDPKFRKIQARLAGSLKTQIDNKQLKRYKNDDGTYVYGLNEWFNEDGTIKEDYK